MVPKRNNASENFKMSSGQDEVRKYDDNEFLVRCSFIEIYQDEVYDLLNRKKRNRLDVREGKNGFYVQDLTFYGVKQVNDAMKILKKGQKSRTTGATKMNAGSSRSHSLFTVVVESSEEIEGEDCYKVGKLNLVDLAGSERQAKTEASGQRLNEAKAINLALSALGNVIKALVNPKRCHIPFRDSKLTKLLNDSLGGNSKTTMIANVGPAEENYDETMSTLRYARRAKSIKNKPSVNNQDPKDTMIATLKEKIRKLKSQLENNGHTIVKEEEVVQEVIIWKGVQQEEVNRLKAEAVEAQKVLEQTAKEDEAKYVLAKAKAEEAAKLVSSTASNYKRELKAKLDAQKELSSLLREREKQLVQGGQKLQKAVEQQKMLQKTNEALQKEEQSHKEMQQKLERIKQEEEQMTNKFSTIQEEIQNVNKQIKIRLQNISNKKEEIEDLQSEYDVERQELTDTIRQLTRQLKLKDYLWKYFIPQKWMKYFQENADWDDDTDMWRVPGIEFAGNNINDLEEGELDTQRYQQRSIDARKRMTFVNQILQQVSFGTGLEINPEIQQLIETAVAANEDPKVDFTTAYSSYGVQLKKRKKRKKSFKK